MKIKICIAGLFALVCALSFVPREVYASSSLVDAILQQTDNKERHINTPATNFPAKFDLRSCDLDGNGQVKNYVTSTKQQNTWGNCWAHGGIAAAEISILAKQRLNSVTVDSTGRKRDSLDLSEHHLSWFNYAPMTAAEAPTQAGEGAYSFREEEAHNKGLNYWWSKRLNSGGIGMSVTSAFSRGDGPVIEPDWYDPKLTPQQKQLLYKGKNEYKGKDDRGYEVYSEADDWAIDDNQRSKKDYELNEAYMLPDAATFKDDKYDLEHAEYVTKLMKQQLMAGRGLFITYNCDNYTTDQKETMKPRYINVNTWCQYAYKPDFPSHCVCVVGWDDTIQPDKFLKEVPDDKGVMHPVDQPPKPGAWIVKNSWGAADSIGQGITYEPWGLQDSGYFYLSYYDQSLVDEAAFDFNINFDKNKITHQHNYMSSEKLHGVELDNLVTTANIFCANTDEDLIEVSGMTNTENVDVNYKVYLLDSKEQQIDTGNLLCSVDHTSTYKGFHRVKLDKSYHINKGQYFAVTSTQKCGNTYIMSLWYDCNHAGYDKKMTIDDYFCKAIVNPGESFVYADGKWTDYSQIKAQLESSEKGKYYTYDNFPIKAYATPSTDIKPDKLASTGDNSLILIAICCLYIICYYIIRNKAMSAYKTR